MVDKAILNCLFEDAGIERSALLAECICTLDKYLNVTEDELKNIQWVDKTGEYQQMLTNKQIDSLIAKRDLYLENIDREEEQIKKLQSVSIFLSHVPVIKNILKYISPKKASKLAKAIRVINEININNQDFVNKLEMLTSKERDSVISLFSQIDNWNYELLEKLPEKIETFAKTLWLRSKFQGEGVSILDNNIYLEFKNYLLINWFTLQSQPDPIRFG
jgi:hypothetical protein